MRLISLIAYALFLPAIASAGPILHGEYSGIISFGGDPTGFYGVPTLAGQEITGTFDIELSDIPSDNNLADPTSGTYGFSPSTARWLSASWKIAGTTVGLSREYGNFTYSHTASVYDGFSGGGDTFLDQYNLYGGGFDTQPLTENSSLWGYKEFTLSVSSVVDSFLSSDALDQSFSWSDMDGAGVNYFGDGSFYYGADISDNETGARLSLLADSYGSFTLNNVSASIVGDVVPGDEQSVSEPGVLFLLLASLITMPLRRKLRSR